MGGIAGYILAGGKNSRMDGKKKAFLMREGIPFWKWIANAMEPFECVYISVENRQHYMNKGTWDFAPYSMIEDVFADMGPMGGILSGLLTCEEDALLVATCDMPLVSREMLLKLKEEYEKKGRPVFYAVHGEPAPFPGVYTKDMLRELQNRVNANNLRMMDFLSAFKSEYVLLERDQAEREWENINTMEEYKIFSGAKHKVTVEEAVGSLTRTIARIEDTEEVIILEAVGRTLAEDIRAKCSQPPFPRSPLDGYAVRALDTKGASRNQGVRLKVIDKIYAGGASHCSLGERDAVRIMTGAPIPKGADAVIRQEDTSFLKEEHGDGVTIYAELSPYQNYCKEGEDFHAGDRILAKGTVLHAAEAGILAAGGYNLVKVQRRIRVAVFTTGNELVEPGNVLEEGTVYNSNLYLIVARLKELDTEVIMQRQIADEVSELSGAIREAALTADVILTTGGVSVGEKDIVEQTYYEIGAEICFHGVKMKPGSPMMGGKYKKSVIISFSGNPYGAFVNMELFLKPVLEVLSGNQKYRGKFREGILEEDFLKISPTPRFVRANWNNGRVRLASGNASGVLSTLSGCNCLLRVSENGNGLKKGETVCVRML